MSKFSTRPWCCNKGGTIAKVSGEAMSDTLTESRRETSARNWSNCCNSELCCCCRCPNWERNTSRSLSDWRTTSRSDGIQLAPAVSHAPHVGVLPSHYKSVSTLFNLWSEIVPFASDAYSVHRQQQCESAHGDVAEERRASCSRCYLQTWLLTRCPVGGQMDASRHSLVLVRGS